MLNGGSSLKVLLSSRLGLICVRETGPRSFTWSRNSDNTLSGHRRKTPFPACHCGPMYVVTRVLLCSQLKSLGYLCGLVAEKGPTSEDLNRTVDLLAGLGEERPETGIIYIHTH